MARWEVPLSDVVISEEEIESVAAVYRSGWLSMGPETEKFERELAEYVGVGHVVAAASGTAALHLMCCAAGLGPGDEVIVPSMTFVATVSAIAQTGAEPVFADIAASDRPWLSVNAAASAVSPRTRAIMTMDFGGHSGDLRALAELARDHDLLLLEDAAHALGSRLDGRHLGSFGNAGALSFFANKNLPIGEGGAIITDDDALAGRARLLRSHGMTALSWDRARGHAAAYDVLERGFNYRLDDPRAALARRRLARLDGDNAARRHLDQRYRSLLTDVEGITVALAPPAGLESAHHLSVVVLDPDIDRDAFRSSLSDRAIQTSVHYPPVHWFSAYGDGTPELPHTESYARRGVTLPLFPHMTEAQQDLVVTAVRGALVAQRSC